MKRIKYIKTDIRLTGIWTDKRTASFHSLLIWMRLLLQCKKAAGIPSRNHGIGSMVPTRQDPKPRTGILTVRRCRRPWPRPWRGSCARRTSTSPTSPPDPPSIITVWCYVTMFLGICRKSGLRPFCRISGSSIDSCQLLQCNVFCD